MIKKLIPYCADCIRAGGRSSAFNNLKLGKENKIIITDSTIFEADNKEINEIMKKYALNKSTMAIYKGALILEDEKNRFYSPLLYTEAKFERETGKIKLIAENENMIINIGLISSLIENDVDIIENTINELTEIEQPEKIDFKKVLSGLINLDGFEIKEENIIFLAKMPENIAGLLNELKLINKYYEEL